MKRFIACPLCVMLSCMLLLLTACGTPDEKKMAFFSKGKTLYDAGDFVKARLEFKNAIQIDPEFADGYHLLGKTELKLKNGKAAFTRLSQAVKLNPELIDARLDLGRIFLSARAYERSESQAEEILKIAPDNMDAQMLKASVYLAQKEPQKAGEILDVIYQSGFDSVEFYLLQASCYSAMKKNALAGEVLFKGMKAHPESTAMMMALAKYHDLEGDIKGVETYLKKAIENAPETTGLQLNLAWIYLKTEKKEDANQILSKIIDEDPENEQNILAVAVLLMRAGEMDKSIEIVNQGIEKNPESFAFYSLLREIYLKQKQLKKAEDLLRHYLALGDRLAHPDMIKAKINLVKLFLIQERITEAEPLIDQVLEDDPKNIDAHHIKGRICLVRKDSDGAIANFRTVIKEHPEHLEANIGLATAHALNKDYDLALDILKSALKKTPESARILKTMVKMNVLKKDAVATEKNLKQILSLDPYNLGSIAGLGDFYLSLDRYEDAMSQYQLIKTNKDKGALGYIKTAQALIKQDHIDEAIDELKTGSAGARAEDSAVFATALGQLYLRQGNMSAAKEKFTEALSINPKNKNAWLTLAQIYELSHDYESAMGVYRQCLEHFPDLWLAANNLAFFLAEFENEPGAIDKALELAKKAQGLMPDSPLIQDTLGWIYYKKGDFKNAENLVTKAHEKMPENAEVSSHLGLIYHARKMPEQAAPALKKALAGNDDYLGRKDAIQIYNTFYKDM